MAPSLVIPEAKVRSPGEQASTEPHRKLKAFLEISNVGGESYDESESFKSMP